MSAGQWKVNANQPIPSLCFHLYKDNVSRTEFNISSESTGLP